MLVIEIIHQHHWEKSTIMYVPPPPLSVFFGTRSCVWIKVIDLSWGRQEYVGFKKIALDGKLRSMNECARFAQFMTSVSGCRSTFGGWEEWGLNLCGVLCFPR